MLNNYSLSMVCNIIPAMLVLFYIFRGWIKGGLYMIISIIQLFGSYVLTRILSNYLTNLLILNPVIKEQVAHFVLNNKDDLTQLPGASLLFSGKILENNIESISYWLVYFICFILIFIILMVLFSIILRMAINFNKIPILGIINRLFGCFGGLFYGLIITLLLVYMISFILNLFGYYQIQQVLMSSWLPVLFRTII